MQPSISKLAIFATATLISLTAPCRTAAAGDASQRPSAANDESKTTYELKRDLRQEAMWQVRADLEVGGDIKVTAEGKVKAVPMSVAANLQYAERLLFDAQDEKFARRSVRHYDKSEAVIKIDRGGMKPRLRKERRILVADVAGNRGTLFSPAGHLTREELDLVDILGNTLVLPALLPHEAVAVGDHWEHDRNTMQLLLGLDAVSQCDVKSTLEKVNESVLLCGMEGTVDGAVEGVATEISLKAKYHYHRKLGRITALNLAVKEDRSIGHVGPGLDVVAKLELRLRPIEQHEKLSDEVLAELDTDPTPENSRLAYESPKHGFRFLHDRRWFITGEEPELLVMRLIDRGDLIAQCNIAPLPRRKPEKPLTLAEYQSEVKNSLGEHFGQFVRASQEKDEHGQIVFRIAVQGQVQTLPITWHYYHLADPQGNRLALAFTVEAGLAPQLNDADRRLVESIELFRPSASDGGEQHRSSEPKPTAHKTQETKKR